MASPTPSPNPATITIPISLLAVLLAAFLAVAGWGASIVSKVADNNKRLDAIEVWQAAYEKDAAQKFAAVQAANAKTEAAAADYFARSTAQNSAIQETLTQVRIQLATK